MINKIATPIVRVLNRWMPDPFIFAVLLTLITIVLSFTIGDMNPISSVNKWGNSFWKLLAFTTQISMTLVTGHVVAHTPAARTFLTKFASHVRCSTTAYLIVGFAAAVGCFINWSVGLIVGAIIAREMATICVKKNITVHYPLLVATAYSGYIVWHQGFSGTIPLLVATPDHFLVSQMGQIPVQLTTLSWWNLTTAATLILTMPFVMMLMKPKDNQALVISEDLTHEDEETVEECLEHEEVTTPAAWIENSKLLNWVLGGVCLAYLFYHFAIDGASLDLNLVNLSFLTFGLLLSRSPIHFVNLVTHAGSTLGPIMLQFPFYAGIMALMVDSGLAKILSDWFVHISTARTLPFWSFISSGILNIFVPSGGGGWAIQGPIMVEAAKELGADMPRLVMAVVFGDQWTNMVQPFWTIPALAIAGLQIRDIMGYCVIALFWSGLIFTGALMFF